MVSNENFYQTNSQLYCDKTFCTSKIKKTNIMSQGQALGTLLTHKSTKLIGFLSNENEYTAHRNSHKNFTS